MTLNLLSRWCCEGVELLKLKKIISDDVATAEDIADIAAARAELARGEAVEFEDIEWE